MHALGRIHRSLRSHGALLDVHPQPENARVEVWQKGHIHAVGQLDEAEDSRQIRAARARLDRVERRGLFLTERQATFELLHHYPSVHDWLERRARVAATNIIPRGVLAAARRLLTEGGGELVLRERARATLLRRSAKPA